MGSTIPVVHQDSRVLLSIFFFQFAQELGWRSSIPKGIFSPVFLSPSIYLHIFTMRGISWLSIMRFLLSRVSHCLLHGCTPLFLRGPVVPICSSFQFVLYHSSSYWETKRTSFVNKTETRSSRAFVFMYDQCCLCRLVSTKKAARTVCSWDFFLQN